METCEIKYELRIEQAAKAIPTPKECVESLKGVLGQKQISKMKKESLNCAVKGRNVSFIECFSCKNFVRRVRGVVYCRGNSLESE
ncbi:TPA: hypothetical protein EYP26_03400 [Candidatus Bathyarchaeota archaeon]|nr:hypothetical protein [Candidatus Bathyarchaeota archaeon]